LEEAGGEGRVVRSARGVGAGDRLETLLSDGSRVESRVERVFPEARGDDIMGPARRGPEDPA